MGPLIIVAFFHGVCIGLCYWFKNFLSFFTLCLGIREEFSSIRCKCAQIRTNEAFGRVLSFRGCVTESIHLIIQNIVHLSLNYAPSCSVVFLYKLSTFSRLWNVFPYNCSYSSLISVYLYILCIINSLIISDVVIWKFSVFAQKEAEEISWFFFQSYLFSFFFLCGRVSHMPGRPQTF